MLMPQEEVQDASRTEHEAVGLGKWRVGRLLPRLRPARAEERHQYIGNLCRPLTPALLPEHAIRLEIDVADARQPVALPKAVTTQVRRRSAERASQALLINGTRALGLRDAQPAKRDAGRPVTPPVRRCWIRIASRPLPPSRSAASATDQPRFGPAPSVIARRIAGTCGVGAEKAHHAGCAVSKTGEAPSAEAADTFRQRPRTGGILRANEIGRASGGSFAKLRRTEALADGECRKSLTRGPVRDIRPIKKTCESAGK